jgi:radical SAM superfamily enzyme YgiQ (UPF0313 family)
MKLAPEHASPDVLRLMNKPGFEKYEEFETEYKQACADSGRDQYLANYFIVGHPGTTLADAIQLFEKLLERNYSPEQAQEFLPLPMTRAMVQFAAGVDPITGEKVYVPRTMAERKQQKALVRWKDPDNRRIVEAALVEAGRKDLLARFRQAMEREQKRGGRGVGKGGGRSWQRPRVGADEELDVTG